MFFLWIILFLIIIIIGILSSICKLEIRNIRFSLPKVQGSVTNDDYKIVLKIYIYGIIKIFDKDIANMKVKGEKLKNKICNVEINFDRNNFDFDLRLLKTLKKIDAKLEDLDLKIYIGTEDAAVTAIIVGIVWGAVANILRSKTKDNVENDYFVEPVYLQKNLLKINLDGIFKFKMRNILGIIIKIVKKNYLPSN